MRKQRYVVIGAVLDLPGEAREEVVAQLHAAADRVR